MGGKATKCQLKQISKKNRSIFTQSRLSTKINHGVKQAISEYTTKQNINKIVTMGYLLKRMKPNFQVCFTLVFPK